MCKTTGKPRYKIGDTVEYICPNFQDFCEGKKYEEKSGMVMSIWKQTSGSPTHQRVRTIYALDNGDVVQFFNPMGLCKIYGNRTIKSF